MKQHLINALEDIKGFINSVIRFNGSFGSPADALAKAKVLEEELLETVKDDTKAIDGKKVLEMNYQLMEENNALFKEIDRLKKEKEECCKDCKCETCEPTKPLTFDTPEPPKTVWCNKCFGLGYKKVNEEEGYECPVCKGKGRRPYKK